MWVITQSLANAVGTAIRNDYFLTQDRFPLSKNMDPHPPKTTGGNKSTKQKSFLAVSLNLCFCINSQATLSHSTGTHVGHANSTV